MNADLCRKVYEFLIKHVSSHGISPEKVLADLAEASGLVYIPPGPLAATSKRQASKLSAARYGKLHTREEMQVAHVTLRHRDAYARAVEQEGLGGSVADGDWWGFSDLSLVEDLVRNLANFRSSKLGRGSRYEECLAALKFTAEKQSEEELSQMPKKKGKKK